MTDIEYDLDRAELRDSQNPFIRFRDLIPVHDDRLLPSHGRFTDTVHAVALGDKLGMTGLYLKNETLLLTGTTKDRMAAVAIPYLYEGGVRGFCTSSTGNSSTAYAHAITQVAGMTMYLFTASDFAKRLHIPDSPQVVNFVLRDATFVEAFDAARAYAERNGLISERGFFNPGRREGLKLAFLEAADQVPGTIDWYFQAVSSAMGVYGTHRGACQMKALGAIAEIPRMVCVQQDTCAPMVTAWESGSDQIRPQDIVERPIGIAKAILRGNPTLAYPPVRQLVVATGGTFVAVSEVEIRAAHDLLEDEEGISSCFAAAAALAGAIKLRQRGDLAPDDTVLVNITGRERTEKPSMGPIHWLVRSGDGWEPEEN